MRWATDHTLRGGCSREVGCGMEREAWERRGLSDTKVTGGVQGTVPSGVLAPGGRQGHWKPYSLPAAVLTSIC